jgi:tRNA threonylcarbamoyl adenosine modification protein YeaZ
VLLAIDTSAGASVALVDAGRVLAQADETDTRGHAEAIGRLLERVLQDAGAAPRDVTAVVSGMGPGPFTGLRVGIAAARAFAAGRGIPVHPVASHDAVAYGTTGELRVVTDARRREIAWTRYLDGEPVDGPHLAPADGTPVVAGISAANLALRAAQLLARGDDTGPSQPLYLRAPDITPSAGPKRVTG